MQVRRTFSASRAWRPTVGAGLTQTLGSTTHPVFMLTPSLQSNRTLRIGGVSKSGLLRQLRESGVQLNALALDLIAHDDFQPSVEQITLTVVQTSVAELGLNQGGHFEDIVVSALARGYSLCPLEVGPHLRLAFSDQIEGFDGQALIKNCAPPGSVTVASRPVSEDDDIPKGFYLRVNEGVPWLRGYRSWHGHVWSPTDVFAFAGAPSAA